MLRALLPLFLASPVVLLACSVEPTANDGKYHPTANGQAMTEGAACSALSNAIDANRSKLQCVGTSATCPSLVQNVSAVMCAQYDQGTIQGCVDYFGKATTCQDLSTRIDNCVFVALSGSAPKGCP